MYCGVCGGEQFQRYNILWPQLIQDWQLSAAEAEYINRQHGESCNRCGSNLRSIALANAIRSFLGTQHTLVEVIGRPELADMATLEINEAGTLSPLLRTLKSYTFGAYPEVDIHALPYGDESFDLVLHSDTLEHVPNPLHALEECRRVLKRGGALCFTIPIVVGRMTRGREGLPKSYHGNSQLRADDYVVHTEFGADAWTYLMEAGFSRISIHAVAYPCATAFLAHRD